VALIPFENSKASDRRFGGKASGLANLTQKGFTVPRGLIIHEKLEPSDWQALVDWWDQLGAPALAVRSSAAAEDGARTSFAGQNKTFLNIQNQDDLKRGIRECFGSIHQDSVQAYRDFFKDENSASEQGEQQSEMNVVLQEMINPLFSGVFFSHDPRNKGTGWYLEVVPGFGESLVSGRVTPGMVNEEKHFSNLPHGFTVEKALQVAQVGIQVAKSLGYSVDMEWAIDPAGVIQILQARPITTVRSDDQVIAYELERLRTSYPRGATWDGQTFAEWSGFPSYFTFSIWKRAFSPHFAFGSALKTLGYKSFDQSSFHSKDSLLERVFGRAYINLDRLTELYYGPIPYVTIARPRPHLKFKFKKVSLKMISYAPSAVMSMLKVSWNISTNRRHWLDNCSKELHRFRKKSPNLGVAELNRKSSSELFDLVFTEADGFAKEVLYWPFILIVLTESTIQRLLLLLSGILGEENAQRKIREWLGRGLHTQTFDMQKEYIEACNDPDKRDRFLLKYGHRGPRELDLMYPRWNELGDSAFKTSQVGFSVVDHHSEVEKEILALESFKREIVLEEWRLLKEMLELRENWKMEILKPYASIRYALNALAERLSLNADIHWLRLSELQALQQNELQLAGLKKRIEDRKERFAVFRKYSFPEMTSREEVEDIVSGKNIQKKPSFDGEALSPGIIRGEVRLVLDPVNIDTQSWPENTILVAESTDPSWTPLFVKSKAIVVEKGGVLSHCAIVAREMGIPAVSGIFEATKKFKDGDKLWVDGNHGRIAHDTN